MRSSRSALWEAAVAGAGTSLGVVIYTPFVDQRPYSATSSHNRSLVVL